MALLFVRDIDGASLVDAQWAITCNDSSSHPGPVAAGDLARDLEAAISPDWCLLGVVHARRLCWLAAPREEPVTNLHPVGAPPVLVIGNTGDPNTPIEEARRARQHLSGCEPRHLEGMGPHLAAKWPDRCLRTRFADVIPTEPPPAADDYVQLKGVVSLPASGRVAVSSGRADPGVVELSATCDSAGRVLVVASLVVHDDLDRALRAE